MGNGDISLLGGIAQGIAQGQMFRRKQEQDAALKEEREQLLKAQSEMSKLQMQKYKIELERLKQEAKDAEMLRPFVQQKIAKTYGIKPDEAAKGGDTQQPEFRNFPQQPKANQQSIVDEILAIQNEIAEGAMLDKATGGKYQFEKQALAKKDAMTLRLSADRNQTARDQFDRGWLEQSVVSVPVPGAPPGTTAPMRIPKYGGAAMPIEGVGAMPPKPEMRTEQLPTGAEVTTRVNPYSGEAVGEGITSKQAPSLVASKTQFAGADALLGQFEKMLNEIIPAGSDKNDLLTVSQERFEGGRRELAAAMQSDPKATAYRDFTSGTLAPFIRAMGEKGALAEGDVQRAIALIPKLSDRPVVARMKLKNLKELIASSKAKMQGGGVKIPPGAIDKLQEGVVTTFGNGQRWTMQNGQPVQVP